MYTLILNEYLVPIEMLDAHVKLPNILRERVSLMFALAAVLILLADAETAVELTTEYVTVHHQATE